MDFSFYVIKRVKFLNRFNKILRGKICQNKLKKIKINISFTFPEDICMRIFIEFLKKNILFVSFA